MLEGVIMKKLILIGGDLAGGKSEFSNRLGKKFKITVINKDRIKEILGDTIIVNNREENKKLSVICFQLMKYLLEKNEGNLILESNFKDYEMKELKVLCDSLRYDVLSFKLIGNDEVLHKRFIKRLGENRHYVHKSQDFSKLEDFRKTLEELRKVEYIGKYIEIDCSDFRYQNDEKILECVAKFLNN